ncbi:MAG: Twin-arginine translocation protein TatC [uncultured Solirubrobacteraceae bacterium]|uniref:Sec-independent protein translocase protein TatC n=1 Tax=uncultured Solirubrobacteraceae bacterium TaxID=1162706 RepID=A0A6J4RRL9_9ACTN|nr:MAG: Twin-arginine translocation protein TatC [uncultured Solirubrobacteraceae bacterium]
MATRLRPIGHDERLSLVDHLDELRKRLIFSLVVFTVFFGLCIWQNDAILDVMERPSAQALSAIGGEDGDPLEETASYQAEQRRAWLQLAAIARRQAIEESDPELSRMLTEVAATMRRTAAATPSVDARRPVTLGVGEPFAVTIKVSAYAALLLSLPVLLWQLYAFVLPAFSPRERQVALPLMLAVPFLFVAGVVFAYLVVLPRAIDFLQNFNDDQFDILLQARDYYRFSILLLIVMGLLFQIPVAILGATRMGIVSVEQLRRNRRYALLVIAVLAMLLPGTDPITMVVSMLPLALLYEGSILFAALLDRRSARERERVEAEEAQRELDDMAVEDDDLEPTFSHSDDKGPA